MLELSRIIEKVELTSHTKFNLLAGKKGITNMISWVHLVETEESCPFLSGKELALLTGAGLKSSFTLSDMVKSLHKHKVSGIILFPGPYIDSIPTSIISYCDDNALPLFTMPWLAHMEEIIRIITYAIMTQEETERKIGSAFYNAILFPEKESLYLHTLTQNGFQINDFYSVCMINLNHTSQATISQNKLEHLCVNIQQYLSRHGFLHTSTSLSGSQIFIVICSHGASQLNSFSIEILNYMRATMSSEQSYSIGIGKNIQGLKHLYKSYQQANTIQKLQHQNDVQEFLFSYENMGIYQLLLGVDDPDIIKDFYTNTLAPLDTYDRANDNDLGFTLSTYIKNNGSVKKTAEELHVHRNTINHKLEKISNLLNLDLSNWETRAQLVIALKTKNLIS